MTLDGFFFQKLLALSLGSLILFLLCWRDLSRRYRRIINPEYYRITFAAFYITNVIIYVGLACLFVENLWEGTALDAADFIAIIMISVLYFGFGNYSYVDLPQVQGLRVTNFYDLLLELFSQIASSQIDDVLLSYQKSIEQKELEELYERAVYIREKARFLKRWDPLDEQWSGSDVDELMTEYKQVALIEEDLIIHDNSKALKDISTEKTRIEHMLVPQLHKYVNRFLRENYSDKDKEIIEGYLRIACDYPKGIPQIESRKNSHGRIVVPGFQQRILTFTSTGVLSGMLIGIVMAATFIDGDTNVNPSSFIIAAAVGCGLMLFFLSFVVSLGQVWQLMCILGLIAGLAGTFVFNVVLRMISGEPSLPAASSLVPGMIFGVCLTGSYAIILSKQFSNLRKIMKLSVMVMISGLGAIFAALAQHGFKASLPFWAYIGLFFIGAIAAAALFFSSVDSLSISNRSNFS